MTSSADASEAQPGVEMLRDSVGFPHLEEHRCDATLAQRGEHGRDEHSPSATTAPRRVNSEILYLRLVDRVSGDDVPRHTRILHRDEERHARRDAVAEVALRPGIREAGPLDRRDRRDVSETGGSDQEASVRGAPPTLPEPPRAAHTPARR